MSRITITPQFEIGSVVYLRTGGEDADACIVVAILVMEERRLAYLIRWPDGSKSSHAGYELTDNFDEVLAIRWSRGADAEPTGDTDDGNGDPE